MILAPSIALAGTVWTVRLSFIRTPLILLGTAAVWLGCAVLAWILIHVDQAIPASKKRIRFLSETLRQRYEGVANAVGYEPALAPEVEQLVEQAAAIYLK